MVVEMKILKSPGKAIVGSSTFDKPILVFLDQRYDYLLKPIGKKFSDQFHVDVKKGHKSVVRQTGRALNFGN
jgi:hypothetical protein